MKRYQLDDLPFIAKEITYMCRKFHVFSRREVYFDKKTRELCVTPRGGDDERRVRDTSRYLFGGVYDKGVDEKTLIEDLECFRNELGY